MVGVVGLRCERGGEEEEEEEGVSSLSIFSHCLVYLPVSFRRAIFPCVVISLPLFSLSLLGSPLSGSRSLPLSLSIFEGLSCLRTRDTGMG